LSTNPTITVDDEAIPRCPDITLHVTVLKTTLHPHLLPAFQAQRIGLKGRIATYPKGKAQV